MELSQGDCQVRILTFKISRGQKRVYRTFVVVLFPIRDACLSLRIYRRQNSEQLRFYRGMSLFKAFISIQIVRFTKKSQPNSTVRTTPTNSTFEPRTSTSE